MLSWASDQDATTAQDASVTGLPGWTFIRSDGNPQSIPVYTLWRFADATSGSVTLPGNAVGDHIAVMQRFSGSAKATPIDVSGGGVNLAPGYGNATTGNRTVSLFHNAGAAVLRVGGP